MLADSIFITIFVIFDAYPFQVALFKDPVLYEILTIEPADPFKSVIEMLTDTNYAIFFQDKPITFSFVETFLISEKTFLA